MKINLVLISIIFCFNQESNAQVTNVDLSTYVRVGRYNLPEPTATVPPINSLLAQEVSAVTYNWDTNTLFVIGDGSTSIVQVSKTGELIDSMTLAQGSSPQGTEFYDSEGLAYIGNGQFVMSEERDRQVVLFTYVPETTLVRANTQTVKLGTFVNNIGTEGLSFDPITGGYIVAKEIQPIGLFQTNIDFNAGTATNGSPTTVNSINLFDPALLNVLDIADVFALSNIPSLNGQPQYSNILVLSQESGSIVNVDRNGNIANTLTIVSDPDNPLNVASQQHEGLTMDSDGILYVVSENGGGDVDHPQLWVYAPSLATNQAPTAITLTNTTTDILENSNTTTNVKVSDIVVTDDGLGTNNLYLSGPDAAFLQIIGSSLYINAGTVIDYETQTTYNVTVNVDDVMIGATPDASVNYILNVTDVVVETPPVATVSITEVAPWSSGNSPVGADWFEVTNNGTSNLDITGWKVDDNSNSFVAAVALNGITTIAPGESVIFIESSASNSPATVVANFKSVWFGANPPAGLQVGTYQGSGIGLSSSGDAVNLFDSSGNVQASVSFGVSPSVLYKTFNNALSLNNTTISLLSEVGVNDAFVAVNDANEIGSPGSIGRLFVSEVAPWSSGNSPVGADWFEVTNTKAFAVDITGWKVDDNSQSPVAAVPLNGITSINPGESVIFIETNDLPGKTITFLNNWFGVNPPASLRIGNYTGSGIGLSSGGDQVNLYNASNVLQTSVLFGVSPTGTYTTFDNTIGQNSLINPLTQFSAVAVNGAFIAANSAIEIGSPGTIVTAPCLPLTTSLTIESATPYTWSVSGLIYTTSGTYTFDTTNNYGCTVVNTLILTINNAPSSILVQSNCGLTLPAINSYIYANLVPRAQAYRFEVTDLVTNQVQTIDRALRVFQLTQLGNYAFDRMYQIRVAVKTNNVWSLFGSPCTVTTPIASTTIQTSQCGSTIASFNTSIYANLVSFASGYQFEITNTVTSEVQVIQRQLREFRMSLLSNPQYNSIYNVRVAVRNTDGTYLPYGTICTVSIPDNNEVSRTSIKDDVLYLKATAYPNPYDNTFNLEVTTSTDRVIELRVYDMIGKLIETRKVDVSAINTIQIGDNYPTGIYYIVVNQGDQSQNIRVIKR